MGTRDRRPRPRSSKFITREGFRTLEDELEHLWRVERPKVTQEVADAAAHGDRSENAEYIYGKKRLREIDSRLGFLGRRLKELEVVEPEPRDDGRIFFGAWVTVEDEEGEEREYRIVGPDEADARRRYISMDSPIGRALLGKQEGDDVEVHRPKGTTIFTVSAVRY